MKALITFVFVLFFSVPPVSSQGIPSANGWTFVPNAAVTIDTPNTGTFILSGGFQSFVGYGSSWEGYPFVTHWVKYFLEYPALPDTIVIRVKFVQGVNVDSAGVGIAVQDSNVWYWINPELNLINLNGDWQEVMFDMSHSKSLMSNFGKLYIVSSVSQVTQEYTGDEKVLDYIGGIDDTLGNIIYDDFNDPDGILNPIQNLNDFVLEQNYPNPFNPSTTIKFTIPIKEYVTLKVFNLIGQEIQTLVDEEKTEGSYEIEFNASGLPSGYYFYRLQTGNRLETKKMILIK